MGRRTLPLTVTPGLLSSQSPGQPLAAGSPILLQQECTESSGISRGLATLHALPWRMWGPNEVRVKGHAPDDTCEYISRYLQLLFGSSSQRQPFGVHVHPVSIPTPMHKLALQGLVAEGAGKEGVFPSVEALLN